MTINEYGQQVTKLTNVQVSK